MEPSKKASFMMAAMLAETLRNQTARQTATLVNFGIKMKTRSMKAVSVYTKPYQGKRETERRMRQAAKKSKGT